MLLVSNVLLDDVTLGKLQDTLLKFLTFVKQKKKIQSALWLLDFRNTVGTPNAIWLFLFAFLIKPGKPIHILN